MSFKGYLDEGKQVGVIYHFTRFKNMMKLLKGNKELDLEILEFMSYNGVISTTRNYSFSDNILDNNFPVNEYNIRIAIDGTKLSNKYKVKPLAGYYDNDGDIFNQNKNYKRVSRSGGESEEAILSKSKKVKLKNYIIEIQIYDFNHERDSKYAIEIESKLKSLGLNIPVNLVRKFKPLKESINSEQGVDIIL